VVKVDLFEHAYRRDAARNAPLAVRMRPRTLEELYGQEEVIGPGSLLRRAIEQDLLQSLILYGPPGTGKTA
jgi:putative ATPase